MRDVASILGPGGLLSRAIPSYEPRPGQVQMAEGVAEALHTRRPLIVEAGTGTGKTLAYLVPAILSGLKVVISTGTKNLQEQIFRKDVPLLQAELPVHFTAACMKGISNYLCLRRFSEHDAAQAAMGLGDATLDGIRAWARATETGDRAELPELADDAPVWREVSATAETRLGPRCPRYEDCFVTQARRRAQAADLVIVNHHLFFADLALRTAWPQAQLLPTYEAVIFDEAHQIEDVATDYFGVGVSSVRLAALARDVERAIKQDSAPERLGDTAVHVLRRAEAMFTLLRGRMKFAERGPIDAATWAGEPEQASHALDTALEELESGLGAADGRKLADGGDEVEALARRCRAIRADLSLLVEGAQRHDAKHVFWAETRGRSLFLHASPIDISDILRERLLGQVEAAVFTSATLTAGGSFEFVRARLGLESALEARQPSPFDYRRQALLYLPTDLPEPGEEAFADAAAERMRELVELSDGRAFLLFTSHRQLKKVYERLAPRLRQRVLVQGEKPKHLLVEEFKREVGTVLFATASFWEGVDVAGEALSLVVIDKLPFAPPDDPVLAARIAKINAEGRNAFMEYQLPRAVISLKQGAGRLIRDEADRGVLMICDPRLISKSYGKRIWRSLPPMTRTRDVAEVAAFFDRESAAAAAA